MEDERNFAVVNIMSPPLYTNGSGDFLLLDRLSYHRLRGFNEVYRYAKIHIDSNFCVKAHANGYSIVDVGAPVYHVGAATLNARRSFYKDRLRDAPWGDERWNWPVIYDNPASWGLLDAPERRLDDRVSRLDFTWDAVPLLVDLRRVLLPAARTGSADL